MAEETTDSGTNWGALASILAGLVGGMSSGQSLTGEPNKQVSNTGPLTPEGQRIMDEYTKALDATPVMSRFKFGGQDFSLPNKRRLGILKNMATLEAIRRGNLSQQPAETGLLGKLAPLLASLGGKKDIWGGVKQPTVDYDAGKVGYDPTYKENPDNWRMNSYSNDLGE